MTVVQLPSSQPTLSILAFHEEKESYLVEVENMKMVEMGAKLRAQCTSDYSYPGPNVSVYFENILFTEKNVDNYKEEMMTQDFLQKKRITIDFYLKEDLLVG